MLVNEMKPLKQTCPECKHKQTVTDNNIWQDIKGSFTVCEKCNKTYDVEMEE